MQPRSDDDTTGSSISGEKDTDFKIGSHHEEKEHRGAFVFVADDTYARPLAVALRSLAERFGASASAPPELAVAVLDVGLSSTSRERLESCLRDGGDAIRGTLELVPVSVPNAFTVENNWRGHTSVASWAKLLLTDVLPGHLHRAVYLDCDIVVRADLAELLAFDLEGCPLAAVRAFNSPVDAPGYPFEFPDDSPYFSTGVMVLDLDQLREQKTHEHLSALGRHHAGLTPYLEQDLYNLHFQGNWKELPLCWNVQGGVYAGAEIPEEVGAQPAAEPAVVHFSGLPKPWEYLSWRNPYLPEFFEVLDRTPWQGWRPEPEELSAVVATLVEELMNATQMWQHGNPDFDRVRFHRAVEEELRVRRSRSSLEVSVDGVSYPNAHDEVFTGLATFLRTMSGKDPDFDPDSFLAAFGHELSRHIAFESLFRDDMTFVQIGAHEGNTFSDPVFHLARRHGWNGVLVEPVPYVFEKLVANYAGHPGTLRFENAAISSQAGQRDFYCVDERHPQFERLSRFHTQLGSFHEDHLQSIGRLQDASSIRKVTVPCLTFHQLLEKHGLEHVDLLFVDTEGHDVEILMSIDFTRVRPGVIVFENMHSDGTGQRGDRYRQCLEKLEEQGYEKVYENVMDTAVVQRGWFETERDEPEPPMVGFPKDSQVEEMVDRVLWHYLSMTERSTLENLAEQCKVHKESTAAFVECGVARGGCLALMTYLSNSNKSVWGFDSFEAMPPLSEEDVAEADAAFKPEEWVGVVCGTEEQLHHTFDVLGLSRERVQLRKGWFDDTLVPNREDIGPIAVLRLDNDWYASTRFCLETLYDQVISGGAVIIDDYGLYQGCRRAVDEFRQCREIRSPMVKTNGSEHYWVKP